MRYRTIGSSGRAFSSLRAGFAAMPARIEQVSGKDADFPLNRITER
jgi:hypothetical protein